MEKQKYFKIGVIGSRSEKLASYLFCEGRRLLLPLFRLLFCDRRLLLFEEAAADLRLLEVG